MYSYKVKKTLFDFRKKEFSLDGVIVDRIAEMENNKAEEEIALCLRFVEKQGEEFKILVIGRQSPLAKVKPLEFDTRDEC